MEPFVERNEAMEALEGLIGEWTITLSGAWFIDPPTTEVEGWATIEWLGDSFLRFRGSTGGDAQTWDFVFGRSDARDADTVLYHDERGVCRVFAMTFGGDEWNMVREDPDFHQRWLSRVEPDRIVGRWEASEDEGSTWRKDFDLVFTRGRAST
jgi:hypothetical protein